MSQALERTDGVEAVSPPVAEGDQGTLVQATLEPPPYSTEAFDLIEPIRDAADGAVPGTIVGGASAVEFDVREAAAWDSVVIPPIVLVVVFLILVLLLRAVVAPLILIGTVILSFVAALGVGYLVFDLVFDFPGSDPSLPLFAFVFLVALGVDYNIFLMARAREETLKHGTREGMLRALAVTGGVITSAGIVLAGTFSVLAVLPLVFLTEIGFIVAFGVLLDTFLVRSVLVPAIVLRVGDRVWWPSALARGQTTRTFTCRARCAVGSRRGERRGPQQAGVPRADGLRGRPRGDGRRAAGEHADERGRRGAVAAQPAAEPAQRGDRPLRGADDGEPVLRPLLRLAVGRRRRHAARQLPQPAGPAGAHPALLHAGHRWGGVQGLRPPRSRATAGSPVAPSCAAASSTKGSGNDEFALTYFNRNELGFIHAAAQNYTSFDRWFCSVLASTYPNRHYKWGAQSGGNKNNRIPADSAGEQWETIFDRALKRGLSARYYNSDLPFSALYGPRGASWTSPISRYYQDCAAGTLPNISFVDPPFKDGGGGDGLSADEHPLGDVRLGQAFMADVVNAFVRSPNYRRGAMFVVYDEWGGFFDHVAPAARRWTTAPAATCTRTSARWASGCRRWRSRPTRAGPGSAERLPGRPRRDGPRVDPQADQLPLRARLPHQAPPLRPQRRAQLQLAEPRLRRGGRCPTRPRS